MGKRLLLSAAAVALTAALAACDKLPGQADGDAAATQETAVAAPAPELGAFGVTTADIDGEVAPGDDFYKYVSGKWIDTFEIPEEFSSYSSFTVLFERSEKRVKKIIEDAAAQDAAPGSNADKVGKFYASFVDTDAINAAGLAPIQADLDKIAGLTTKDDVARAFASPTLPANSPFGAYVDVDSKNTSRYIVYMTQAGLGMPNKTYYTDEKFADKKAAYLGYVETMLSLAGVEDAAAKAAGVLALEEKLAAAHWEPAKRRNRDLTYNLKSLDELVAFAPEVPWAAMMDEAGLGAQSEFVIREDTAIQGMAAAFAETDIDQWKDYLTFHLLNSSASVLPSDYDDARFAFFGTELRGTPKQRERWKRGVAAVNGALGEAVGAIYVDKYFPASSKEQMVELVENLRLAMDERLDTLPWMGEATKEEAHAKLKKFTPKIGYPDKWKDYSALEIEAGDAYGNFKRQSEWGWGQQIGKLGKPIDRTEWFMTPQTVNAYYSPNRNEIVFPAAILQAPFFDPNADAAVNYGGIGAVIGHEIGHGFDDQGRKSDGDGILRDWWTEEDAANFKQLTDKLGAQYGEYEPVPGFKVKPDLTMGENIGDVGGLAMAYYAYKLSLNGEEAPIIDGYTGDQRFFMAWAQVWKRVVREEALKNQIETDPHSPAQYRVNGVVRNMDAWYEAFGVSEGDALYLAPEDRVQIW